MDFQVRRGIVEALRVEVTLANEDGTKTIRVRCILGDEGYYVLSPAISKLLVAERRL
jgi:hypothetical protein